MAATLKSRFGLDVTHGSRSHRISAHVFLQGVVRHANGMLLVTPVCSSLEEMEGQIETLKGELDEVLRQARKAFSRDRPAAAAI